MTTTTSTGVFPEPDFAHLLRMTDSHGTFEHAEFAEPRRSHGYCVDDVARVLLVVTREPAPPPPVRHLVRTSLRFLDDAQHIDGRYRNRMNRAGRYTGRPSVDDCWGRAIWALGTAVTHSDDSWVRQTAMSQFERAARQRSRSRRSMAFATIGAAEVLVAEPWNRIARDLVADAAAAMVAGQHRVAWPWPEERLHYANAVLPEAMIAAGVALENSGLKQQGLDTLAWLVDRQTTSGHLSVTPAGGSGIDDNGPAFDQQPIEVAAVADACARAAGVDNSPLWSTGVAMAVRWFLGENDGQRVMWDPRTGGGYDGLQADGVNLNQGAESTLALLSTLQHARRLVPATR
jgi:hypothetical protein